MKIVFYSLYGTFGLLGLYFVASSLFGHFSLGKVSQPAAKSALILAGAAGAALLYWAYQLGELQSRPLAGSGAVLLAFLAFQAILVIARLTLG